MIERFQDQVTREHLLSVTLHTVSTFSKNTNNILSCKDETAGIHSNMKV